MEASLDPNLKVISEAPPLAEETPPPPPAWMRELIEEANEASKQPVSRAEWKRRRPRVPTEYEPMNARAKGYAARTYQWLTAHDPGSANSSDPRHVISWFHFFIAAKINRALTVWPGEDPEDRTWPSDSDGSAKVALIGIERSHAAWLELVEGGMVAASEADPFIADLVGLGDALERARPHARSFVRPGFDEPEAVARLLAGERGQR
jgi:hypothetical protein